MANFTFSNNGNNDIPATYDQDGNEITPFIPAAPSPSAKIVDENGNAIIVSLGETVGLAIGRYTIEVVNG